MICSTKLEAGAALLVSAARSVRQEHNDLARSVGLVLAQGRKE